MGCDSQFDRLYESEKEKIVFPKIDSQDSRQELAAEEAALEILSYLQREANYTRFSAVRRIILRNLRKHE